MKPSQEIAEEMVTTMTPTELRDTMAQLIEVARAAKYVNSAQSHVAQVNYNRVLSDTLIALRATGKAEWL
jgi:hypothetical protein